LSSPMRSESVIFAATKPAFQASHFSNQPLGLNCEGSILKILGVKMNRKLLVISIAFQTMVAVCFSIQNSQAANRKSHSLASANSTSDPAAEGIPKDLLISLDRTLCFGFCPSYRLTIKADGSVIFEGREHVKQTGTVKSRVSEEQLRALLAEFERIKFFSLRNTYNSSEDGCTEVYTDHPSATITILANGKTKRVQHYHGCKGLKILEDLLKFENRIDEIVNTNQWIK
jgi:hypothetical protein